MRVDFAAIVKNEMDASSFSHYGLTPLEKPLSMDVYREWIAEGHHGSMQYLADHADIKAEPRRLAPRAVSALVVAKSYFPHPYSTEESRIPSLRTALYAQGEDYHFRFKAELEAVAEKLRARFTEDEFLCFTDSAPILERDLAYRAGLGWIGKNTCLIHPDKGSLFFIGQILTSRSTTQENTPIKDFCGTCDRCIRACPTGAIVEPRKLVATKCIAYWTIEAPTAAPVGLRTKFGDWFFGCDICQTVCPWNEKAYGKDLLRSLSREQAPPDSEDLKWILNSSNNELARAFQRSPLIRARARGLKRNAIQIIGQLKILDLRPEVESHLDDPHLGEIASWALTQLT